MNGTYYDKEKDCVICEKCGAEISRGVLNVAKHWNECIDNYRTCNSLINHFKNKVKMGDFTTNGKPAQCAAMTCEYIGCQETKGKDYKRTEQELKEAGTWASEPIYLCDEHEKDHELFNN